MLKETFRELLAYIDDDSIALVTPSEESLTYGELISEASRLSSQLSQMGITQDDRVAILLPNGPSMVISFLAVIFTACAAPLNPKSRASEIAYYLNDLGAAAIITDAATFPSEEPGLAQSVVKLHLDGPIGNLNLSTNKRSHRSQYRAPRSDDAALVLHTSGTTSRPKLVPLRQGHLVHSAINIARSLELGPTDRSMNVMPLFHIHGLLAGLLAPLAVGGSVISTNGFDAFSFFSQLERFRPTYYTAVPTMHQMVLSRSKSSQTSAPKCGLRFVRSSSASLPTPVLSALTELFQVPVIEAYGMTEATHQMCSNPLPPAASKPGSVGLPSGIDLCVLDPAASTLEAYERGEIAIRGPNVMVGYENNEDANREAFTSGWFRTGDEGYIDSDGYVFLTGRLKEQINRGGEKVSPVEVDAVLLTHPKVQQAVTFAIPHDKLGEEVGAAVVLSSGGTVSATELRNFLSEHLASFKVPRKILFLEELPKGPTGKLQRIGLASRLGLEN